MVKFIKSTIVLVCIGLYGFSAIDMSRPTHSISIDTGRPLSITWPCETAIVGDNGEKGLRIGPNIGRGWRGEAGGEASYSFYIPADDRYHIWAYCLWFDECANAVFAKIDDLDKATLGNDPIYKQWHWVRGFDISLKKGTHRLVLSNHSDHIALQEILLTNAANLTPADCGLVFSDIFYDGFDGCDHGNFDSWQVVGGQWLVQNPENETNPEQNVLIGRSEDCSFIIYKGDDWSKYSLDVSLPAISDGTDGTIGICFGVKDPNQYHQLSWQAAGESKSVSMKISQKENETVKTLAGFETPWEAGQRHQVEISLNEGKIVIKVDKTEPVEIPVDYSITGGIGLRLEGNIKSQFDDIHVRATTEVSK